MPSEDPLVAPSPGRGRGRVVRLIRGRDLYARWQALSELNQLQSIIPMCAWCKDVRTNKGAWWRLEAYFSRNMDAAVSHGICPECARSVEQESGELSPHPS